MDSNGPEGSSFPSYPREEMVYLPMSNTPPLEFTGAIPNLHEQAKDIRLVGSSSLFGEESSAFSPSESVNRSVPDVLQLPSKSFRHIVSLIDSESSQRLDPSSPHHSHHSSPDHSSHSSPDHSPHCAHHCDINGILAVPPLLPSHSVYHGAPRERRRREFHPLRFLLHLAMPTRRSLAIAQHATTGRRSARNDGESPFECSHRRLDCWRFVS